MSIFDLLFLALVLVAAARLLTAGWCALRRQFGRSRHTLQALALGAAIYMAIVVLASVLLPQRVLKPDATECFDDWCIGVAGFKRLAHGADVVYDVDLRLSSRARRASQRENNLSVYLTDKKANRYDPLADPSAAPFNVLLRPRESVVVRRTFFVPADASDVGLVVAHEGGFPIGWLIIGYSTWFRKAPVIELRK
jgi:hypothetical protein